jgi:hypothetical protein
MTLIGLASRLAIKNRCEEIASDLKHLAEMKKLAKKCVSEMAVYGFVENIETQIKYLKNKRKEIVKNFEKGAKLTYKNEEGDVYKCDIVFESATHTDILYWVPYLEEFRITKIDPENISVSLFKV